MTLSNALNVAKPCLHLKFITKKLHYLNNIERSWDMAEAMLIIISYKAKKGESTKVSSPYNTDLGLNLNYILFLFCFLPFLSLLNNMTMNSAPKMNAAMKDATIKEFIRYASGMIEIGFSADKLSTRTPLTSIR